MIKKIISFILILVTLTTVIPTYSNTQAIESDYSGHWAEKTIKTWLDKKYIKGYPDGSFKPEGFVTRAEFVKMVNASFGYTETTEISFTDVTQNNWYYQEVQKAFKANYISGISKEKFAPNNKITREQAAIIISKILELELNTSEAEIFSDSHDISDWAWNYIGSAVKADLIRGYEVDNSFKPQNPIKRAEAIELLNRALKRSKIIDLIIDEEVNPAEKTIKILTIGNSFSQDTVYYLYDIASSAGVNVIVGNVYYSGCSLEKHWSNAINNVNTYSYYKWASHDMTKEENKTMKDIIIDEKWDYITFQQSSSDSGIYTSFQPYLNNLITYVKGISKNPDVKLALNMTWAYSSKSTNDNFVYYNYNQNTMYNAIVNAYKQAVNETDIDILIPCGTAIQNARTNKYLKAVGNELTFDGYHLNPIMGRYIAGLTLFETIIKKENINKDIFEDVKFIPSKEDNIDNLVLLAKKAVKNAIANTFEVTSDKAKSY